jgi:hypothetical protein
MDLSRWSQKDVHVGAFAAMRLSLRAKPYRCEYCRLNFVSFRRRHERFSFKRWANNRKPADPA